MNTALLVVSLTCFGPAAPPSDLPDAEKIEKALNQGVELDAPDCEAVRDLRILAGGVTRSGELLYVCEGDLVWSIDVDEYKAMIVAAAKRQGKTAQFLATFAPQAIDEQLAAFKKGDLITRVRIRVRLEKAGTDWIAVSSKIHKFDPTFSFNE